MQLSLWFIDNNIQFWPVGYLFGGTTFNIHSETGYLLPTPHAPSLQPCSLRDEVT